MGEVDEDPEIAKKVQKRLIIGSTVAVVLVIAGVLFLIRPQWYQNYAPVQPIPFSHKTHAGKFNVPCLYCHGAAEYTAHAEVPGLEVCMNCHTVVKTDSPWIQKITESYKANKPIEWVKVHVLPDFVHFNHKRHVAAGVECQTCHGPVQEMDRVYQYSGLHMGWCVNCHRDNNYVTARRADWSKKEAELGGVASGSSTAMFGKEGAPKWFELLSHKNPHNADVSCTTCHY